MLPVAQNIFYAAVLYFFLRALLDRSLDRVWTANAALLITLLPTNLILVNGALYTEALMTMLVLVLVLLLLLLGALLRMHRTPFLAKQAAWGILTVAASALLGVTKGS